MTDLTPLSSLTPLLPHPLHRLPTMDPKLQFHAHFLDSLAVIQDQISQLATVAAVPGERQEAIDHILAAVAKLQSEVADAAEGTVAYDRRMYGEVSFPTGDAPLGR